MVKIDFNYNTIPVWYVCNIMLGNYQINYYLNEVSLVKNSILTHEEKVF